MLAGLLKFVTIWFIIDAIIIAVGGYFIAVIKPRYPDWWRRTIADKAPPNYSNHF